MSNTNKVSNRDLINQETDHVGAPCHICELQHDKEGLEYCVAALVVANFELKHNLNRVIKVLLKQNDTNMGLKQDAPHKTTSK